jgi:hypothetical protein
MQFILEMFVAFSRGRVIVFVLAFAATSGQSPALPIALWRITIAIASAGSDTYRHRLILASPPIAVRQSRNPWRGNLLPLGRAAALKPAKFGASGTPHPPVYDCFAADREQAPSPRVHHFFLSDRNFSSHRRGSIDEERSPLLTTPNLSSQGISRPPIFVTIRLMVYSSRHGCR